MHDPFRKTGEIVPTALCWNGCVPFVNLSEYVHHDQGRVRPLNINMDIKSPHILCVEDDKDSCDMIKRFLQLANPEYVITTAEDGAAALSLIQNESFDLYLLDNWLPGVDGMEICRRIREMGSNKPIVFFSAMVRSHDRETALEAGADAYLLKPNDLDILPETVAHLLTTGPAHR